MNMIWQCGNAVTIKAFILKHFLIICEVVAVILAFVWPYAGSRLSHSAVSLSIVALIFLFTGLKLKTDELKTVYRSADVLLVCCISSLLVTALIPNYIATQLPFDSTQTVNSTSFTFGPSELQMGIFLFHCAPATIATGIIMVTAAGGDLVIAVTVSTLTNVIGCFLTPLTFSLFADADAMKQDSTGLIMKIGLSLLLPLVVGKLIAMSSAKVRKVVTEYKKSTGVMQSIGICVILWIKLSSSIYKGTFNLLGIVDVVVLFVLLFAVHLLLLLLNFLLSIAFCFNRSQAVVMMILCSQKTLVLTAAMASALPEELGDQALILLPCFVAHPLQMLVDSFLLEPLKNTQLFPACLPACCVKWRTDQTQSGPHILTNAKDTGTENEVGAKEMRVEMGVVGTNENEFHDVSLDNGETRNGVPYRPLCHTS